MGPNRQQTAPAQAQQPSQGSGAIAGGAAAEEKPQPRKANSTQNSLLISELRDNMVIMGDGSFRAVVACKSINFDLMSLQEREGVEYSYQNFINSLTFPVQILIRSQRIDIGPYLDKLGGLRSAQENMLLNVLMDDYIQFIDILSQEANIMDKSFFIIIPYSPAGDLASVMGDKKGFLSKLLGQKTSSSVTKIDKITYEKVLDELKSRVDSVMSGIIQVGIQAVQLNTRELGELYYNVYNPDTAVREPLGDFASITSTYVRRGGEPLSAPIEPVMIPADAMPLDPTAPTAQPTAQYGASEEPPQ